MQKTRYVVFDQKEMETKFIGVRINTGGTDCWFARKPLLLSEKCLQWMGIISGTLILALK